MIDRGIIKCDSIKSISVRFNKTLHVICSIKACPHEMGAGLQFLFRHMYSGAHTNEVVFPNSYARKRIVFDQRTCEQRALNYTS